MASINIPDSDEVSNSTSTNSLLGEGPATEETSFSECADGGGALNTKNMFPNHGGSTDHRQLPGNGYGAKNRPVHVLPDLSAGNWYLSNCFRRYWQHYGEVQRWCHKHYSVVKSLENQQHFPNVYPYWPQYQQHFPNVYPYWPQYQKGNHFSKPHTSSKKKKSRRKTKRKARNASRIDSSDLSNVESMCVDDGDEGSLSLYEMEISEDMREFFAHTERHRQQRDRLKELENEKQKTEKHINIEEVTLHGKSPTSEAPVEQPGARRTVEMKLLYGKGAAMIHGMETALQMNYDRNMDIKQPPLWPNMPLKVIFH